MKPSKLAALLLVTAPMARAEAPGPAVITDQRRVVNLSDVTWVSPKGAGFPPGVEGAPITLEESGGGSVGYARIPKGKEFPLHWHSHAEQTIVISGKGRFTLDGKAYPVGPGSYVDVPAKAKHALACAAAEDCIIITRRTGPVDYHWEKQK